MFTEAYLSGLKRGELQALAKSNGVKANLKSADIIAELLAVASNDDAAAAAAVEPAEEAVSVEVAESTPARVTPTPAPSPADAIDATTAIDTAEIEAAIAGVADTDDASMEPVEAAVDAAEDEASSPMIDMSEIVAEVQQQLAVAPTMTTMTTETTGDKPERVQKELERRTRNSIKRAADERNAKTKLHFAKTDKLRFMHNRPTRPATTPAAPTATTTPRKSASTDRFGAIHDKLFNKQESILATEEKRQQRLALSAKKASAPTPAATTTGVLAPSCMSKLNSGTKPTPTLGSTTTTSAVKHGGAAAAAGSASANASSAKRKFNLQESLSRPVGWKLKTGKVTPLAL